MLDGDNALLFVNMLSPYSTRNRCRVGSKHKQKLNIQHEIDMPNTNQTLLPTGSEERGVFEVGSIPVAILPSCQDMKLLLCNA